MPSNGDIDCPACGYTDVELAPNKTEQYSCPECEALFDTETNSYRLKSKNGIDKARIRDSDGREHNFDNVASLEHDKEENEIRVEIPIEEAEYATKYEFIEPGFIERVR